MMQWFRINMKYKQSRPAADTRSSAAPPRSSSYSSTLNHDPGRRPNISSLQITPLHPGGHHQHAADQTPLRISSLPTSVFRQIPVWTGGIKPLTSLFLKRPKSVRVLFPSFLACSSRTMGFLPGSQSSWFDACRSSSWAAASVNLCVPVVSSCCFFKKKKLFLLETNIKIWWRKQTQLQREGLWKWCCCYQERWREPVQLTHSANGAERS